MIQGALSFIIALLVCLSANAAIDVYQFDTEVQRDRYNVLIEELRCPKCQNQNLAGSNSEIAIDLRRELHRLLIEGKRDREIKDFMVARYGDFVLYKPPLKRSTLFLWFFPVALLFVGLVALWVIVMRRRKGLNHVEGLSQDEQSQLDALVNRSNSTES